MDFRKSVHFDIESEKLINSRPLILFRLDETIDESFRNRKIEECIQFIERLKLLCESSTNIGDVDRVCNRIAELYADEPKELEQRLLAKALLQEFSDKDAYIGHDLKTYVFFNSLIIKGVREVRLHCEKLKKGLLDMELLNSDMESSLEKLKKSVSISQRDQNLPLANQDTDLETTAPLVTTEKDQPINYKVHLMHKLGCLEPLKRHYKEINPNSTNNDFAKLLAEILDTNKVGTVKRVVSAALSNEDIESQKLKDKLYKTLKDHNFEQ